MQNFPRVAILGAGIMGSSTALFLARKGVDVSLFDMAEQPFSAASRWNEGKIHLGCLYSADPSLSTADHLIPGGLTFRPLVEELIGASLAPAITTEDDLYLCHRQSVTSASQMRVYMEKVFEHVREHPHASRYLADASASRVHQLSPTELAKLTSSEDIVAGFWVPERSVNTNWVADQYLSALAAEKSIKQFMGTHITAARPAKGGRGAIWQIETSAGTFGPYDYVINSLWQGRLAIDRTAGLEPTGIWSNRYRQSLFLRTAIEVHTPCAIIATGPFGDIKNYNGRDFYLSWYPDGLRIDNSDISPPHPAHQNEEVLANSILNHLQSLLPWVQEIREHAERFTIEGGWVFAAGQGLLSDRKSTLHRRCSYGATRFGNYISIDTGKYSTAPAMARALVEDIL